MGQPTMVHHNGVQFMPMNVHSAPVSCLVSDRTSLYRPRFRPQQQPPPVQQTERQRAGYSQTNEAVNIQICPAEPSKAYLNSFSSSSRHPIHRGEFLISQTLQTTKNPLFDGGRSSQLHDFGGSDHDAERTTANHVNSYNALKSNLQSMSLSSINHTHFAL